MTTKMDTMDLKGNPYAKVPTRIKEFRKDCPQGLIETTPTIQSDGQVLFKARILKDKSNPSSGEATGHSIGQLKGEKNFEKLETIAVGRALALLGYMASGEIASGEEMEEFQEYRLTKWQSELDAIETIEQLKAYYAANRGQGSELDMLIKAKKDSLTPNP